jgi:glycosyltransferase involved in cell wall biosynthesis
MFEVSVIIPTFNRGQYVINAIDSVLSQSYTNYEIIVVDDGSKDNTRDIVQWYADKIKYIYQNNAGVSVARNRGIAISKGKWLAFLDSDDEWMTTYLSTQIERASKVPGICMQTANCCFVGLNGKTKSYFEINRSLSEFEGKDYLLPGDPFSFIVEHGPWQIGATIILRDAIMKAGLFDPGLKLSEDYDLMARVAFQGRFGMIRKELMRVYRREESLQGLTDHARRNPMTAIKTNRRVFENLKRIAELNSNQRKLLNNLLSANKRAMGNLLIEGGKIREARVFYKHAIFDYPSIKSIGKYILSFLPVKLFSRICSKGSLFRVSRN